MSFELYEVSRGVSGGGTDAFVVSRNAPSYLPKKVADWWPYMDILYDAKNNLIGLKQGTTIKLVKRKTAGSMVSFSGFASKYNIPDKSRWVYLKTSDGLKIYTQQERL